jgi:predicted nucleotidyltransferase
VRAEIMADFEPGRSLLDLAGLLVDLEDLLGHPVDVVTEPGLKARIRQRVLAEAVAV